MRTGWGPHRWFHRAATAFVALTLIPVAVVVASAHGGSLGPTGAFHAVTLHAEDTDLPSVDALQRSQASNLFAPFFWSGQAASGPFVSFGYSTQTGTISDYAAVHEGSTEVLVPSIRVEGFSGDAGPQLSGATFAVNGPGIAIVAHQEPMALLEMESASSPQTVVFTFATGTTALALSHATSWPRSTLTFAVGDTVGSLILWKGGMSVNGSAVTAAMQSGDYLALRAVPSFASDRTQRTAILNAFGSGRLAAEYDLVAMRNGGWLENAAEFQPNVTLTSDGVDFSNAALTMTGLAHRDGVLLIAFDPGTMPSDAGHRVVVTNNGVQVPQAQNPLAALYATTGASSEASFSLLAMNATVLVVYLPSLATSSIQVQSIALPAGGIDVPTELAMVAALFIVSLAAAAMFRTRRA